MEIKLKVRYKQEVENVTIKTMDYYWYRRLRDQTKLTLTVYNYSQVRHRSVMDLIQKICPTQVTQARNMSIHIVAHSVKDYRDSKKGGCTPLYGL